MQHKDLANGKWQKLSIIEQLANIGSEVERAINWRAKNNEEYSRLALNRAFELIDLTLGCKLTKSRFREIARTREVLVDYFLGDNCYNSSVQLWKKYFLAFGYATRNRY